MAIIASNTSTQRELIPPGNYPARCYQMIHIGTITETIQGEIKTHDKVRIGWELPTKLKVFEEAKGEQPLVISKEFTLFMSPKANLRKMLASWRGKDFTEEQAKSFDVTALLGVPCMLNIIHKPSKDGTKLYEEIQAVTPMPDGYVCPPQINKNVVWDYDNPDLQLLANLPDFIKEKIVTSVEYKKMIAPQESQLNNYDEQFSQMTTPVIAGSNGPDDLPF